MTTKRETNLLLAHSVLDWNRTHLKHDATLTAADISQCFADHFIVEPNGRHYEANSENYLEFLDGMRASISGIEYQILHAVADDEGVVFDMNVEINHTDNRCERFVAMLLMQFDQQGKVTLWKETYFSRT